MVFEDVVFDDNICQLILIRFDLIWGRMTIALRGFADLGASRGGEVCVYIYIFTHMYIYIYIRI